MSAVDELFSQVYEFENPSVVGLDPQMKFIPPQLKDTPRKGDSFEAERDAIIAFNELIIEAVSPIVGIVKPNIAFYGLYKAEGIEAFEETVRIARKNTLERVMEPELFSSRMRKRIAISAGVTGMRSYAGSKRLSIRMVMRMVYGWRRPGSA